MPAVKFSDIFALETRDQDCYYPEYYIRFREIEEWCFHSIPKDRWRFDYSSTICVHGIDIPGRIIFRSNEDLTAFRLRFKYG
jgi:hypothetical protein